MVGCSHSSILISLLMVSGNSFVRIIIIRNVVMASLAFVISVEFVAYIVGVCFSYTQYMHNKQISI